MTMKSPDEIKKGLECCKDTHCKVCPYFNIHRCAEENGIDALALIQQLEADNAQQARCIENLTDKLNATNEDLPRWISVEERLPEDVVDVLLFVRFGPECKIQFGWHIEDEWHDYDGNIYGEVTHWMPLPEPPKEATL